MTMNNQLIDTLRRDAPDEYREIEKEFDHLLKAVHNCWAVNGELRQTLALATFINTSPFASSPNRLLAYMATTEKREDNGRVLLAVMEYLAAPHFTANVEQRAALRTASNIVSRWWLLGSNGTSFGEARNRELYVAAKKLRLRHELPAI